MVTRPVDLNNIKGRKVRKTVSVIVKRARGKRQATGVTGEFLILSVEF